MKQVRLTAKSGKGKSRLGMSGDVWNIEAGAVESLLPPPQNCLFIRSLDGRDFRWVMVEGDPNFLVELL